MHIKCSLAAVCQGSENELRAKKHAVKPLQSDSIICSYEQETAAICRKQGSPGVNLTYRGQLHIRSLKKRKKNEATTPLPLANCVYTLAAFLFYANHIRLSGM